MPNNFVEESEKKFLCEFIQVYKSLPALWNRKYAGYFKSEKKNAAYDKLVKKYRELVPEASKEDVRKKINSLRTNYRKEHQKYLKSLKPRKVQGKVYIPKLWYFNEFHFLRNQRPQSDSADDCELSKVEVNDSESECFEAEYLDMKSEDEEDSEHLETWNAEDSPVQEIKITNEKHVIKNLATIKDEFGKRHLETRNVEDSPMQEIKTTKEKHVKKNLATIKDECEKRDEFYYWALSCAADLRKMDTTQQLFAKKAISAILVEGQLGQLHRNSVTINEPSVSQCSSSQNSSLP